jgi:hypothetical protein
MAILLRFIHGPYVFLIEHKNGYLTKLCDMDKYRMKLSGIVIFFFAFLLVVNVNLFLGKINIAFIVDALPFSLSTLMTLSISFLPTFMALWIALRMVVVYSLMGIIPLMPLYSRRAT